MDLAQFNNAGFDRGASRSRELAWLLVRKLFFDGSVLPWYRLRRLWLRRFGARLGDGVLIKPGAKITFPWRLSIGRHTWIGEDAWLLNLAPIEVGNNVCISQRAFLCTGSHDWAKTTFDLVVKPIHIEDGAWICADVFVGPGVKIGENTVITAGSVVTQDMPPGMVCSGNPCKPVKPRPDSDV